MSSSLCRSLCLTVLCTCLYAGRVECGSIGSLSQSMSSSLCRSLCLTVLCTCMYAGRVKCGSIGSLSINVFFSLSFLVSHCPMYMSVCRQGQVWQYRFSLNQCLLLSVVPCVSLSYVHVCMQAGSSVAV